MTDKLTIHLTIAAAPGAPRVPIEVASDITGAALRQLAIEATKIPAATLKLIFRGRMIADDGKKAVTEYKLEDGSVLHCMGKPQAENAAPAPAAAPAAPAASLPSVNLIPPSAASAAAAPAALGVGDPLTMALRTLRASNAPQVYKTAIETLEKLLSKIISNPLEEKYRSVKKDNPAFTRRLGGLPGGDASMKAVGFNVETDESGQAVYRMQASAEAWPKLLAAQTTIRNAVQEAQASSAAPAVPPAMPGFPSMNPGAAAGMPPEMMQQAAANLMSNPQAMQAMLNNPMVQNMMRNDPRFANNPMAQQMIQSLASNPEMLQQASQMMSDPNFQQHMQQMQQNPALMAQQMQQMQNMMGSMPGGGAGAHPVSQPQNNGQADEDLTEEEMIAEAIRRSLQDNGNNNN
uniref:Ubiquitin-like domain-containing protein n=1 Tax=Amphora coffeiformis TaxID=265554 RepID=A0A7S3KVY5_9STRA|mmetsp:Transcript_7307/g.14887  ORF Transcript_7307/g.14887 Transcript_7307/m.14887 type:complete len:405 (+) Transcript_7307:57-1271(+)